MMRSQWALWALLAVTAGGRAETPKQVLLVCQGPDGHPPATHEYAAGMRVLGKCLEGVEGVKATVVRADGAWPEGPDLIDRADGVVLFLAEGAKWVQQDPMRYAALRRLAARKGGLIALHWAMGTRDAGPIDGFVQLFGGCHGGPDRKYQVVETDLTPTDPRHPIATGVEPVRGKEEFYYRLKFVRPEGSVRPVLRAKIDGADETVAWAWKRPDGGRSFGFSGLHFHENWRRPEYRRVVSQAVLWTLGRPIPPGGLAVAVPDEVFQLP